MFSFSIKTIDIQVVYLLLSQYLLLNYRTSNIHFFCPIWASIIPNNDYINYSYFRASTGLVFATFIVW